MTSTTRRIASADGTHLLLRSWPAPSDPRACVVMVPGLGEHSGRYEHVGERLSGCGYAVHAIDLRGFGGSDGRRAYARSFDEYLDDLDAAIAEAPAADAPLVLLGHSLGGLVALLHAQVRGTSDLLVLSAPSVDAEIPRSKRLIARMLRRVLPTVVIANGLLGEQLSRDPAVGEAYFADPLIETGTTTALGGAMLAAMAEAGRAPVPPPALVIQGGDDPLVPPRFTEPLAAGRGVTRIVFPGFRHESFNEEGGRAAVDAVSGWIDEQLAQSDS